MRRGLIILGWALLSAFVATGARADASATADSSATVKEVHLRGWYLGLQWSAGQRDHWDVFGRDGLPPAEVEDLGRGFGAQLGHRFGGRFLLGLQFSMSEHDLAGLPQKLYDGELLVTGTVLFRERSTLQPFLRGAFGGGGVALQQADGSGHTISMGTATVAGGGLQVRLGSRFSLEAEAVANFTNFFEVRDQDNEGNTESDWRVDTSQMGWRIGLGAMVWF